MNEQVFSLPLPRGMLAGLFRLPIWLYRFELGGLLGDRFLLLTHTGRKTGQPHQVVIEVVWYDETNGTYYVVSGWGEKSNWYKNILADPNVTVQIGNRKYQAVAERVPPEMGGQVIARYAREHPLALRILSRIMKYPIDGSEGSVNNFGKTIPVITFQTTQSLTRESKSHPKGKKLFCFNGVPIVAQPGFWPIPFLVTGFLAWAAKHRKPQRSWLQCLGLGLLALPVALLAEVGHAMAHTISARMAGAPMDEILLSSGMTRTLYIDNSVPPSTHIQRSLGGPIFSLIGFIISFLWRRFSTDGSISHDLADASLAGHSIILFGSIAPVPPVDGGIILKWKLVEAGKSVEQADQTVHKISLGLGAAFLGLGALLGLVRKRKRIGGLLAVGGAFGIATGIGWFK